ncbi:uncharacterized protein Z519_02136 [Cladophialophora bantiana CBS 173.52]|uniref:Major facilitator superfamily (MFS) profile domain-containing protein n=1 Tax=Cladophialophora bantiana (strain ATCC 10958 / CBS 173.52 / CDC B-1940 / NIH 8579) TaxID=1442370 RepID=A0A0D2I0N5_CLAB1|nr:uncharacterized protein Z519_02136 [Cladophialophora bantiana CBS 173.52]KIW96745.1 hypothetical protein Z519_02136 [Cladophialophora bantiana CBS 173.52]
MELQSRPHDVSSRVDIDRSNPPPSDRQGELSEEQATTRSYLKLICAGFSFFYAGTNDGTTGPLLPYMLQRYNISTGLITVIYVANFAGWFTSAMTNTHLTTTIRLSLGATLLLGAGLQLLSQLFRLWNPPFGLFSVTFFFTSLGQAYQDSYSNTFVATVPGAHRWLGFIHAMYMLGCLTGPFVATPIASNSKWYYTYAVEAGLGVLNLGFVFGAFGRDMYEERKERTRAMDARDAQTQQQRPTSTDGVIAARVTPGSPQSRNKQAFNEILQTLKLRSIWLISLFFFFFLGAMITAGGWVVEYLVRVRGRNMKTMGYVSAGYNGGGFLGRLLLMEPTHRYGERRMVFLYALACLALQIMFWRIPNVVGDAVLFSALGFFAGPFFPTGVSVATKLCPKAIQNTALGFIFVLAQAGGSLFPALTGLVAAHAGVKVLQPILAGLFVLVCASWWIIPKAEKERDS